MRTYHKSFFPLNKEASVFFSSAQSACPDVPENNLDIINHIRQMGLSKSYKELMLLKLQADAANYDNLIIDHQFCFCDITTMRDLIKQLDDTESRAKPFLLHLKKFNPKIKLFRGP